MVGRLWPKKIYKNCTKNKNTQSLSKKTRLTQKSFQKDGGTARKPNPLTSLGGVRGAVRSLGRGVAAVEGGEGSDLEMTEGKEVGGE